MEPLSSLLKIYSNNHETLLNFLPDKTTKYLNNTSLYQKKSIASYSRYQNKNNWNKITKKLLKKL